MIIKTSDKWSEVRRIINIWLKDPTIYCGNPECDSDYNEDFYPCCKDPVLGTNFDHTKAIVEGIKEYKKTMTNDFASNKKRTFRSTVKLPSRLYHMLNKMYKDKGEKLFEDKADIHAFAKKFKQFTVPIKM